MNAQNKKLIEMPKYTHKKCVSNKFCFEHLRQGVSGMYIPNVPPKIHNKITIKIIQIHFAAVKR